jgi:organic radical activating enzyme
VTVVCSPKADKIAKGLLPHIDFYKYVCRVGKVDEDGLPEELMVGHPNIKKVFRDVVALKEPGKVYLQAFDEGSDAETQQNLMFAARVCMKQNWILTVQIHKLAGLR